MTVDSHNVLTENNVITVDSHSVLTEHNVMTEHCYENRVTMY